MANIARVAGKDTMGDMFFSALGGAKDQYRSAVNQNHLCGLYTKKFFQEIIFILFIC